LAAQDVHEPGVFEEQLCRLFAPGDAELLLQVAHSSFPLLADNVKFPRTNQKLQIPSTKHQSRTKLQTSNRLSRGFRVPSAWNFSGACRSPLRSDAVAPKPKAKAEMLALGF